jgi:hypothetical protein
MREREAGCKGSPNLSIRMVFIELMRLLCKKNLMWRES